MYLFVKNLSKIPAQQNFARCITTKANKRPIKDEESRKCDPRPEPEGPPKFDLGKSVGKWVRKYITGADEPKEPPPFDPRPVCSPCLFISSPLPPFPKLHCVYEGVMEHSGNQPPLDLERVFVLKQSFVVHEQKQDKEIAMLNYIETDEHVRDFHDPLPKFSDSAQRLIELVDRKLHPSYKQNLRLAPLQCHLASRYFLKRETRPAIRVRYNMSQLNKKNFYVDPKRCDPPAEMYCTKALDLKVNEKLMLDTRRKGRVKDMLKMARIMMQKQNDNPPVRRSIHDSYLTQKAIY